MWKFLSGEWRLKAATMKPHVLCQKETQLNGNTPKNAGADDVILMLKLRSTTAAA